MASKTAAQLDREIAEALAGPRAPRELAFTVERDADIRAHLDPPQRVEILKAPETYKWKWKPGQFAYAVSYTTEPNRTVDRGVPLAS